MERLSQDTAAALVAYAREHGRTWKAKLGEDWLYARLTGPLQALRNSHGPAFLTMVRIDKTTGILRHPGFKHGYFAVDPILPLDNQGNPA